MMNDQVITPLTISQFDNADLKFFMRLGVVAPSAVSRPEPRSHPHIKWDKVVGLATILTVSGAGWAAVALGIARFLK